MMLLCRYPPSTGRNGTLGHCVVTVCVGAVWRRVNHCSAVAIRMSGKERGAWCLGAVFVIRGALLGMLFRVLHECLCFVNCSAHLVVGLGADMMEGASVIRASVESCGGMLFAGSLSSSVTFVWAPFVWAPFVCWGEHMAPFADLLMGGSICAQGG
jgi:hypothetical protein